MGHLSWNSPGNPALARRENMKMEQEGRSLAAILTASRPYLSSQNTVTRPAKVRRSGSRYGRLLLIRAQPVT
jgi:hypothetical protein